MKPVFFRLLFSGLAFLLLDGCVLSEHPLSAAKDARPDPRLIGAWRSEDKNAPGVGYVSFNRQGLGQVRTKDIDGVWTPHSFFLTQTAKASYINLMYPGKGKQPVASTYYEFYKYALSDDHERLRLWSVKPGVFEDGVKESKLSGRSVHLDSADSFETLLLQDSSETLLHFIEARPVHEVFIVSGNYRKVN